MKVNDVRFEMNKDEFDQGYKSFVKTYYKEELKHGPLKKVIGLYIALIGAVTAFCFLIPKLKVFFFFIIGFMVLVAFLMAGLIVFKIMFSSAKDVKIKLKSIEHIYEEKIYVNTYFENGSVDKAQYIYENIKKVVETEKYYYLFLNDTLSLPLIKREESRDEFVTLLKLKNIEVRELK